MFCPQCGTGLGEGARGCAACGWTASRKTLWIVLGSIFGFLLLVCCGGVTFVGMRTKAAIEKMQKDLVPIGVLMNRIQVLNYARKRGSLPADLGKAMDEPVEIGQNDEMQFKVDVNGKPADAMGNPLRYTPSAADGTYEVRSAGLDGQMDTADDVVEKGTVKDDLDALVKQAQDQFRKFQQTASEEVIKAWGMDPSKMKGRHREPVPAPAPATPEAPEGPEPPKAPEAPKAPEPPAPPK